MDESEDNLSADDIKMGRTPTPVKPKPRKKSLVERELETSLTARVTSPMTHGEVCGTSRYGRALRQKTDSEFIDSDKIVLKPMKSPTVEKIAAVENTTASEKTTQSSPLYKIERELETSLTARVTSPMTHGEVCGTSRYGRALRHKTDSEFIDSDKIDLKPMKSPAVEKIAAVEKTMASEKTTQSSPLYKIERELETSLTARVTSPMTHGEVCGTSRYGRALRHKTDSEFIDSDKIVLKPMKSPAVEKIPAIEKIPAVEKTPAVERTTQSPPVYKMHASNSPIKGDNSKITPIKIENVECSLENQIENIYNENISLSRFSTGEKQKPSPVKHPKLYVRKDLIQTKEKEETITLLKNMFSPRSGRKSSNSHLSNVLERSSEKYEINSSSKKPASSNIAVNNSSVVKTLDFDSKKKRENSNKILLTKSELFELEAKCEYQVGDLAWARMGTYPFWPCIVSRDPESDMFVRKKLFGRVERDIIHVRFFGDNGRRSWIVETMLRKFLGQLEFEATREHFSPTAKKKDPRLYAAFFISEKKMPQWSISVEEAETLLREPKRLRIDIFNDMLIKSRSLKVAKPKSGKIIRTNSDVSLSESLYDTLFSGNDGKSEDSDGSRSKTRKSLDVSEVVTACLDNMAAKTGLSKIQKQSHMDRWLQKAKCKTPEKSQVKLPVPPKGKVISSKKKRCVAPKNVPFIKPYSLRKSYESQNLMSHHNEQDYSCTVKEGEVTEITFQITTKIEPLSDKVDDMDTPGKVDTFETNGTTCESPTYTQDYEDLIFAHEVHIERTSSNLEEASNTTTANSNSGNDINMSIEKETNSGIIDLTEESIEIEHSSVPLDSNSNKNANEKSNKISNNDTNVNNETDNASTYLHMNGHLEDNMNIDTNVDSQNSVNVKSVNDTPLNDAKKADVELKTDVDSPKSVKENETSILNSTTSSQCNSYDANDVNLSTQSIERTDTDSSLDNLSQTLEDTKSNCVFLKPLVRTRTVRKRSSQLKNCTKAHTRKTKDNALAKNVVLRKDALMGENPELSQTQISVNDTPFNDLNKTDNVELKMDVDSTKIVKENENSILISTTASQCNDYDPNDVNLSMQSIERTETDTSLDNLSQSLENTKANTSKINDDAFTRYVELRKDVLTDENPKSSQTETSINDTSLNDSNKTDNVELKMDVDSTKSVKENETSILNSTTAFQCNDYDPNDVNLSTQSIEKTDTDTSLDDLSQSLENTKANTSKINDDAFTRYVELRKDVLTDENPKSSQTETSVNDTSLIDFNKRDNVELKMDADSTKSVKENETSILNSTTASQGNDYDPNDVNLSTQSIEKTDTDTSLADLSQNLENTKANASKINDDAFAKYVELRKEVLTDENPKSSQTETSVNVTSLNDLRKTDNVELKMDADSLEENETSILNSSASPCDGYDPNVVILSTRNIAKTDTDISLDNLHQSLEGTEKNCLFTKPVVRPKTERKRSPDTFDKYGELRKDELMDENPELSQTEISVNDTSMNDLNKIDNVELKKDIDSLKEDETSILNSSASQCDGYDPSVVNLSTRSIEKTDTDTSLDNLSQSLENTEKNCHFTKPVICPNTERKRSIRLKNRFKAKPSKANDDAFAKYVELRKDALMEENPELSPTEIIEYLVKTWQYEKGDIPVKVPRKIIYDINATEVVKSNDTNDKISTVNLSAKKKVCTVTLTDIITNAKKANEVVKNNNTNANISTINLNAKKRVCTVTLSDILLQKNISLAFKNGKKTCILPIIGSSNDLNNDLQNCITKNESDTFNKKSNKASELTNVNALNNYEITSDNLDSGLSSSISLSNEDSNDLTNKEYMKSNMDSEIPLNIPLVNYKQRNYNNSYSTEIVVEIVNEKPDSELLDTTAQEKHRDFDDTKSDLETTSLHGGDNKIIEKDTQKNATSNDRIESLKHTKSEKESTLTKTSNETIDNAQVNTTNYNKIKSFKNAESAKENALTKPSNHKHLINTIEHQNDILKNLSSSSTSEKLLNSVNNSTKSKQQNIQEDSVLENQDKLVAEPIATINKLPIESESISNNNTESNLKNEEEVDRILKSIDDFVNDKDSTQMDCENNISDDVCMKIPKCPENVTSTGDGYTFVNVTTRVADEILVHEPKTQDVNDLKGEISDSEEICHQNVQQPIIMNGYHSIDDCTPDVSDGEFNAETSSINSEDSEPLSTVKSKLLLRNRQKMKKDLEHPEFLKYMEMRQDAIMDEHPELNQEEIIEYMYKTWQYEGTTKSDFMKTDDIEQSGLVKGLNDSLRQKSMRNSYRANKKRKPKPICEDTISISSETSDTSIRRKLRQRSVQSPVVVIEDNLSKGSSPERILMDDNDDFKSTNSDFSEKSTKAKNYNNLDDTSKIDLTHKNKPSNSLLTHENQMVDNQEKPQSYGVLNSDKATFHNTASKDNESKKYFNIFKQTDKKIKIRLVKTEFDAKVKEEYDPETVSINSEDSEISVSKRKQRKYADKEPSKDDPEFLKYLELRQDALIDEHPELSEDDIVSYLFKTWLYEESVKSDIKKSDDIEQASLVKGLNTDVQQPKKVKKKIKVEKELTTDEDLTQKDKPKRKISQPYYVEDELSDSEDIEIFDIFKSKQKLSTDGTNEISEVENDVVDKVEQYFQDLIKPKPNVFKGHIKEKVCDICERTSNLIKCKGCNSMFHVDCVRKEIEVKVETSTPLKGRKKKKKPGRKSKNFDESECYSDDKSQDVSEENNLSIEDFPELETYTVDAENFESLLEVKMKELISAEANYDTSFSDCAITWNGTIAGKCEIVDVKLQAKMEPDYSDFKCNKCQMYDIPVCFVCQMAISKSGIEYRQRCQTAQCCRYYHMECLDHWPQTQYHAKDLSKIGNQNERFEEFMCPRHVCHTCVSDDPRGCKTRFSGDKLARCVRCPATYHTFTKCLPAGSQILTATHIICPRHNEHRPGKVPCHVNTGWCFICALGGSLICCEYCPTSFHAECLNIKPPEGGYMCEDCETGRLPLYGEMVWVKLGHYRWWPGLILHPSEIPDNILAVKHSPGEFVVRFFGQYDYYWVNRGRVFPFQEGDSGRLSGTKSKIDAAFTTAMEHAQRACEIMKRAVINEEEETDIASSLLPPHYVKLKVNKPVGSVVSRRADVEESSLTQCDCNPDVEDPCGPYSHCLNRMLLTECGPSCRAGDRCNNRAFEKRLYPRMAPYRTPQRGWGLRALEDIKAGQFVIEYVGELIDEEEFRRRMNRKHEIRDENFYFLTLDKERMIDAGPKGNLARFMNHCCEPNCETQKWTVLGDVRVGLFAINDIPANSELTFNYNLECVGIEKKRCLCGAKRCSGYMGAKPKQLNIPKPLQDDQPKKTKRTYKKRKPAEDSPSTSKNKPKKPIRRPAKPKGLTEIEKDLLIIKNATNGISSDSECSGRLSSIEFDKNTNSLKRKLVDFSTEDSNSSTTKKVKIDDDKPIEVGD